MPFGSTVTSFVATLYPDDPVAPQVVSDTIQFLPPNPVKGALVSDVAQNFFPNDPIHPTDLGWQLSDYIAVLVRPDVSPIGTEGLDVLFE